jgi:phospholipase C
MGGEIAYTFWRSDLSQVVVLQIKAHSPPIERSCYGRGSRCQYDRRVRGIMPFDRRLFLQSLGSTVAASAFPESIAKALSILPNRRIGSIMDVEHIVIMMQENRSFDHYFGTLNGVRGFADPRAVSLPSGNPVWYQPDGNGGYILPFHPCAPDLGLQFLEDLPHDWTTTHEAWNAGNHDRWVSSKGPVAMAHLTRADIPFHYALADAFTLCDAYHCSLLGPTYPNRHHMWTGWTGNDGKNGGPALINAGGYSWSTFPETLEKAGISWKIYQDQGHGLNAAGDFGQDPNPYVGNYGCNTLLQFVQYQNAAPGSPLFEHARTGTNISESGSLFDVFRQDVQANRLPQVSWIVAPEAYTEHPNWPANYGAWYVSQILDALTANPDTWSKTAFFLTYDENDGFFDHVVPPTPPQTKGQGLSTVDLTDEIFAGNSEFPAGPYGLGMRVPMIVISPWSTGGWINSQVFDHTSLIRFIQARFGSPGTQLNEKNITAWRSAVSGDLTSAFDFVRGAPAVIPLPGTASYAPPDNQRHVDYSPTPPQQQAMPLQETGTRLARGLPYVINACGHADLSADTFEIRFANTGTQAAVFQVRSGDMALGPRTYTVQPKAEIVDNWPLTTAGVGNYDLSVYGPNGFFRAYQGNLAGPFSVNLESVILYDISQYGITLQTQNLGLVACRFQAKNLYDNEILSCVLEPGQVCERFWPLDTQFGWYDLVISVASDSTFQQQFAGHLETGYSYRTDPHLDSKAGCVRDENVSADDGIGPPIQRGPKYRQ